MTNVVRFDRAVKRNLRGTKRPKTDPAGRIQAAGARLRLQALGDDLPVFLRPRGPRPVVVPPAKAEHVVMSTRTTATDYEPGGRLDAMARLTR